MARQHIDRIGTRGPDGTVYQTETSVSEEYATTAELEAVETTANAAVPDPTTTKGDLLAQAGGSFGIIRLPIGTDAQVLTADSGEGSGMKWAAAAGGSSAPTITFAGAGPDAGTLTISGASAGETISFIQMNGLQADAQAITLSAISTGVENVGNPANTPTSFIVDADGSGDMLLSLGSYKTKKYGFIIMGDGWTVVEAFTGGM